MNTNEQSLRQELVDVMQQMGQRGLNEGTAGNASVRCGNEFLITPSGIPAEQLTPELMVRVDVDGHYEGAVKPSSEWRMHTDILSRRLDVNAVTHCHSRFATTLACAGKTIPALHYMTAVSGGSEIRLAPYATFGSQALSDGIFETLKDRHACLMANHGQITLGPSLAYAIAVAVEVEVQASYYYGTLAIGGPTLLSENQMNAVMTKFAQYGQK